MKVCVYALCTPSEAFNLPAVSHLLAENELLTVYQGEITVLYKIITENTIENLATDALAYDQCMSGLSEYIVALPIRFPTLMQDLASLLVWVAQNQSVIQTKLALIAGKVEYTLFLQEVSTEIQITPALPDAVGKLQSKTVGKYLSQKLAEYQHKIEQEKWVKVFLETYLAIISKNAAQYEEVKTNQKNKLWGAVFLVEIHNLPAFLQSIESIKTSFTLPDTMQFGYSGPWICYHFATL